ncbi:MAG: transcription antitermination factor NusB [Dehalogenimonas sp.]|jgi:N utilization substance protein B|uniref:Transcription antitermination protein NusB n=1 Tax=Candidatus Dehalogenimonas loeffleri TaxID=3127115 RepID=A0ABZ2J5J2_9CHLR|nr:transcription antitermination factor NusB [Dehalogenimonas sp.]
MPKRHQARIVALKSLFEIDLTGHPAEEVIDRQLETAELTAEIALLARAMVTGTLENLEEADGIIQRLAPAYPVTQMAPVDRNILRLAIYEVLHDNNVPVRVAINEAVELAKEFGADSSAKFINGVLSTVSTLTQRE